MLRRNSATTEGGALACSYSPTPPPPVSQDKTSPAHGQESEGNRAGQECLPGRPARRPTPEVCADQPKSVGDSAVSPGTTGAGGSRSSDFFLVSGRTRPV